MSDNEKLEIRREVRARIKALSEAEREAAAKEIFRRVEQLTVFDESNCIALFAAMKDEVATAEVLTRWRSMGKRVVIPRVEGDIMRFYDYDPESMTSGAFGIEEPTGNEECLEGDIEMMIVPARAFTTDGVRLGRGGGFYDKYMSLHNFHARKIGIAYACQIFDELPHDTHDITVDEVVFA